MLRQKLSQKLVQKLSPQQIQLIKLLQVPTVQLEERIKQEMEANPALEEGKEEENEELEDEIEDPKEEIEQSEEKEEKEALDDDLDLTDYMSDDEVADYKLYSYGGRDDEEQKTYPQAIINTFHENLHNQLNLLSLDERPHLLAEQIIGSINDEGYLNRPLALMVDDLAFSMNVETTEEELEEVLEMIQSFDPAGIGARDLRECLLLQLENKSNHNLALDRAKKIIRDHFNEFTKKQYEKLLKKLSVDEEALKEAIEIIVKLNPKPGGTSSDSSKSSLYIVPDFTITNSDGKLVLSLNGRNAPDLKVSRTYKEMMQGYDKGKKDNKEQKEAVMFIKQKLDSARWFIDAIKQRQNTLQHTMQAIMEYQYDFFITGEEIKLRPMILKNIADITGLDISTISRVANSKYVQTEFRTFPLKHFFSEALINSKGEEVSSKEVKQILRDLISGEDGKKPLSDQALTKALEDKGYNIARRTVAKYREQLNISVARLRKTL
ncbi:MAG: RNA polymerase factor sigma-54 [Bacteroidetes bacterium]|nr:RNA polymerase factor sigma-54 [Bacteroidota bacterium]